MDAKSSEISSDLIYTWKVEMIREDGIKRDGDPKKRDRKFVRESTVAI